jgi:hypothetical protein
MKFLYYLMLSCFFIISCQTSKDQESPSEMAIGSALMEGTSMMTPIIPGEVSNQAIWIDYIQAHNDRDLNKIAEINAEDWEGYTAEGSVIRGNSNHIEILDNWFKTASPKWEVKWMIANAVKNKDGEIEQWLTTGNDYTDVDTDGNLIFEHNVHDVLFINGKIKTVNVYKRAKAEESADFSY